MALRNQTWACGVTVVCFVGSPSTIPTPCDPIAIKTCSTLFIQNVLHWNIIHLVIMGDRLVLWRRPACIKTYIYQQVSSMPWPILYTVAVGTVTTSGLHEQGCSKIKTSEGPTVHSLFGELLWVLSSVFSSRKREPHFKPLRLHAGCPIWLVKVVAVCRQSSALMPFTFSDLDMTQDWKKIMATVSGFNLYIYLQLTLSGRWTRRRVQITWTNKMM